MKVLITGVAGFVGSTLTRSLIKSDSSIDIYGIDNLSFGYRERVNDFQNNIDLKIGDVKNLSQIYGDKKFDFVVHCAAIAPLPECQINSFRAITENIGCTGSVIDFCLKNGIKNLIFFSSGAIYEGTENFPTPETDPISTRLIYPTTKYLAEKYLEAISRSYDIRIIALRLFNLYGPHQDYFRKQPPLMGYLLKASIEGAVANLFSNGEQRRDYVYIDDLVAMIKRVMQYMDELKDPSYFDIFNVGSGKTSSVNEIIEIIESFSEGKLEIVRSPSENYWDKYDVLQSQKISLNKLIIKEEVEKYTEADISKANRILNWRPQTNIFDGVNECYQYVKKNYIPFNFDFCLF
jgi:nucleoside-diphosphate-sugar epimerase